MKPHRVDITRQTKGKTKGWWSQVVPMEICSASIVALLDSLDSPIAIIKNKNPQHSDNFRPDLSVQDRYLDGYWGSRPTRVEKGFGYILHYRVHQSVVWLGSFGGIQDEPSGKMSYILDAATPFVLTDLGKSTAEQRALWANLKQPGPSIGYYSRSNLKPPPDSKTYVWTLMKRRLQQAAFRQAVFDKHGARCVVTGCTIQELLEVAHLTGRSWEAGHNKGGDGIPLRVDVHRAYDRGLIEIDPQTHALSVLDKRFEAQYLAF